MLQWVSVHCSTQNGISLHVCSTVLFPGLKCENFLLFSLICFVVDLGCDSKPEVKAVGGLVANALIIASIYFISCNRAELGG